MEAQQLRFLGSEVRIQRFCMKRLSASWSEAPFDKAIVALLLIKPSSFVLRRLGANFTPLRLGFTSY
jgi:hypothetical protein